MAKTYSQNFKSLGTVQPEINKWSAFPVAATSGNDLLRVKFSYPSSAIIKGFAWLRCQYRLTSGVVVTEPIKVYPTQELTLVYCPIPSDLRLREIVTRTFESKRSDDRWRSSTPSSYIWSITLEELLN